MRYAAEIRAWTRYGQQRCSDCGVVASNVSGGRCNACRAAAYRARKKGAKK